MMRQMSVVVAAVMVVCMAIAGCDSGSGEPTLRSLSGTYQMDAAATRTATIDKALGEGAPAEMAGQVADMLLNQMGMTITLASDGTATGTMNSGMGEKSIDATWSLTGNAISIIMSLGGEYGADEVNGTVEGDVITLDSGRGFVDLGIVMVLRRAE